MVINLLSEKELNRFITDIIYGNTKVLVQPNVRGEYENIDYIAKYKDSIIKGMLNQWFKLRIRQHVSILGKEPGFIKIDKTRSDLPDWCQTTFNRGEDIYEFNQKKVSKDFINKIKLVRDYLYSIVEKYLDEFISNARTTNILPRIDYGWLKEKSEYDSFEKVLDLAKTSNFKSGTFKIKQVGNRFKQFFASLIKTDNK